VSELLQNVAARSMSPHGAASTLLAHLNFDMHIGGNA
jgi:hypothetical protein